MVSPDCSLRVFAAHPVQYQAPVFRLLQRKCADFRVDYYHLGAATREWFDPGFATAFRWDTSVLDGYSSHACITDPPTFSSAEKIAVTRTMLSRLRGEKGSHWILAGWFDMVALLFWGACLASGRQLAVFGDTTWDTYRSREKKLKRGVLSTLLRRTPAVCYVGARNREFYVGMGVREDRLHHTPHCVENERFRQTADRLAGQRGQIQGQFNLEPGLPVFLFSGKLIQRKHPLELLEAFQRSGLSNRAQLLFAGDGPLRQQLERSIAMTGVPNVRFAGFLNQMDLPRAYVAADVLCLPAEHESWGLVVNEAMACGVPALVTPEVGCAPDLVDATTGWLVDRPDAASISRALVRCFEDRHRWRAMGAAASDRVKAYSVDRMAAGLWSAAMGSRPGDYGSAGA